MVFIHLPNAYLMLIQYYITIVQIATKISPQKERQKGKSDKPLCRYLRQYGSCTARACSMRHVVLESDAPGSSLKLLDLPLRGKIKVII